MNGPTTFGDPTPVYQLFGVLVGLFALWGGLWSWWNRRDRKRH